MKAKAKSGNSRKHKNNAHRHGSAVSGSVRIHGAGPAAPISGKSGYKAP